MKNIFLIISEFISADYKGFYLVNKDGKKFSARLAKNLSLNQTENSLELSGILLEYKFTICFAKQKNQSVSVFMKLYGCQNKNIRRLVPLVVDLETTAESRILVQDFFNCGIKTCDSNKKGISRYHICVGKEGDENAFSMINEIPSKFYSEFTFAVKNNKTEVGFATDFPYTFEGDYRTETAFIYTKESASVQVEKSMADHSCEDFERPVGWSTWDYYFRGVSDECIKENTDFIFNDKDLKESIKYIAIDDGWNQADGDWMEGGRLKSGLKGAVEYIKEKGFKAGIWTAPVRVDMLAGSAMRNLNPALIKNEYGDPLVYDAMYVLDPTHPVGEQFVRDIYNNLAKLNFDFYKIDFLDYIIHSDRFYDKQAGHYDVLRKLLTIIRECVGQDKHIMGCNMPYGVGKGYVQSRRTGLDIHNHWGHIKKCTEFYIPQFASHGKLYFNDIDYFVVRGAETSDDAEMNNVTNPVYYYLKKNPPKGFVWRYGEDFSYNEAKFWASMVLMSGSSIFLGDRLSRLNEKGLGLIKTTIKNADYLSAKPLDLLETPLPSVWYKNSQLFIFNWTDEKQTIMVDVEKLFGSKITKFEEIYTSELYNADNGKLTVALCGRDSLALKGV